VRGAALDTTHDGPEARNSANLGETIAGEPTGSSVRLAAVTVGAQVGRYVVRGHLGHGAMGVVLLANDPELGREVALKMLRTAGGDERVGRVRLLREAQALARISHPNVVAVHDVGISDGMVFLAMEVVQGGTLKAWLARRTRGWQEILEIFVAIGAGLSAAHQAGLVHRDFKPENVLIDGDGRAKVTDFGLAHAAEVTPAPPADDADGSPAELPASASLTTTGMLIGTPAYMSPEQYARLPTDARSDQFAFCVALWEALYRQHPFRSESLQGLAIAVSSGLVAPPDDTRGVPQWVQDCLRRGMSVQPNARWPTMRALLAALERRTSFDASRAPRNIRALRLEVVLGVVLVPAFWVLDWFMLPDAVLITLGLRLVCSLYGVAILATIRWRPRWAELHVHALAVTFSLLIAWSIALMCFLGVGYESPYYAGISLLVICVGQLYSWPLRAALLFTVGVYGFYMAPLVLGLLRIHDPVAAISNQFFLISMLAVTVAAQSHRRRLERRDFDEHVEQGRLRHQVLTDALTGLYNRAQFLRVGAEEIERSRRYNQPLCLAVVDVDGLRALNARHGEAVGDEVLCGVSAEIVAVARRRDIVGRHGGRFAMLWTATDLEEAGTLARRLHRTICEAPSTTSAGPLAVTARIGLAAITADTDNILEAFAQAEVALHAARQGDPVRTWSGERSG